jgi:hypothetical protein
MCTQCLELNALHSQSVDGARVIIPERLLNPPESTEPYVIDVLVQDASEFSQRFLSDRAAVQPLGQDEEANSEDTEDHITQVLKTEYDAISEYEKFLVAAKLARRYKIDLRPFLPLIDFGVLTTAQKHAISFALGTGPEEDRYIWNSLFRSSIVTAKDLKDKNLDRPLRLQRLYTSREAGTASFFEYLRMATTNYVRKLIILKVVSTTSQLKYSLTHLRLTTVSLWVSSFVAKCLGMKNLKSRIMSLSAHSCSTEVICCPHIRLVPADIGCTVVTGYSSCTIVIAATPLSFSIDLLPSLMRP